VHGVQTKRGATLTFDVPQRRGYLIAVFLFFIDVFSKNLARNHLGPNTFHVLGRVLELQLAFNQGAAFSLGNGHTLFFTILSSAILLFLLVWTTRLVSPAWGAAVGLMMGGILGNLSDRFFFHGKVTDWIKLQYWPNFNLADSAIVCSAILITILVLRNISPVKGRTET
jgi:signal peptidase II